MRLRQRMLDAVTTWNEQEADPMIHWDGHMGDAMVTVVTGAARAAVAEAVEGCINAMCPFCHGYFPNYAPAEQVDYGAWLHPHVDGIDNDWVPCEAAPIRVAIANLEEDMA